MATFIYRYPQHPLQEHLWKKFSNLNPSSKQSWMTIGNLNEITTSQQKLAYSKENSTRYNKFEKVFDDNGLLVIGLMVYRNLV